MGRPIAVGIFILGVTELEIHVGGNFTPPPLDIRRCKNTLDIGGLKNPSVTFRGVAMMRPVSEALSQREVTRKSVNMLTSVGEH